jgi:NitT/TauT family transport system ATP-binding protein
MSVARRLARETDSVIRGKPRAMATADRFVTMMGLHRFADSYPHQLSGGMKQLLPSVGCSPTTRMALMDEPFGALDAMTRERLQAELLSIWRATGLSVVFVTHSLEEGIYLADRVVVMSPGQGRIMAEQQITLEGPRDVSSPELNDIRRHLASLLHTDHAQGSHVGVAA